MPQVGLPIFSNCQWEQGKILDFQGLNGKLRSNVQYMSFFCPAIFMVPTPNYDVRHSLVTAKDYITPD